MFRNNENKRTQTVIQETHIGALTCGVLQLPASPLSPQSFTIPSQLYAADTKQDFSPLRRSLIDRACEIIVSRDPCDIIVRHTEEARAPSPCSASIDETTMEQVKEEERRRQKTTGRCTGCSFLCAVCRIVCYTVRA